MTMTTITTRTMIGTTLLIPFLSSFKNKLKQPSIHMSVFPKSTLSPVERARR
jgi:hypothetical protein